MDALAFLFQLAFNHDLRGDTGVVRTRNPRRVVAHHAVIAHQRVHHGLIEGVTHVQDTRDVRGRQLDRERGLGWVHRGGKVTALFPQGIPMVFNRCRLKALGKFFSRHVSFLTM